MVFGLMLVLSLSSYSQYDQKFSYTELSKGVEIYNGIYSAVHHPKGITFINKDGKQYSKYFENINLYGGFRTGLIIYKGKYWSNVRNTDMRVNEYETFPFIEVVKELEDIDETYLDNYLYTTFGQKKVKNYENQSFDGQFIYQMPFFGWARKGEKYAYITKFGELLTDFKYNRDNYGTYIIDTLQNKKIYVRIDSKGNEYLKSEHIISLYNNENFYTFYDEKTSGHYIMLNGYKYPLEINSKLNEASMNNGYPYECNIFADGNNIYHLEKGKIKQKVTKDYYILTNFYKNRAIAAKSIEMMLDAQQLYIINEKGKVVKTLPKELTRVLGSFDKYGQIIIYSENREAVIDYNGNFIIPPCDYCNIQPLNRGLYGVFQYEEYDTQQRYCIEEKSGFYNQFGQKIIPVTHSYRDPQIRLLKGKEYNYLMYSDSVIYILDKENNVIKK